ncbi:MAG: polysaccharide deacetylase family protein [Rhodomicrobium sp.]
MYIRAFWVVILSLFCQASYAAQCNYDAQNSFLSRVVAIDSTGGSVYRPAKDDGAALSAPAPLQLHEKEVVLTFDQGPHAAYTGYILDILDHHCAKATFFFTGSAALAKPADVQTTAQRGHTLAAGPWSGPSAEGAQAGIEKSFAAIAKSANAPVAPFYRTGSSNLPAESLDYFKERGISLWYTDIASGDTEPDLTASKLANRTLERIREAGKGVVQFHDTRKVTVDALDSILTGLKLSGFKVVQIVPAENFSPKADYLGALPMPAEGPGSSARVSRTLLEVARRRVQQNDLERAGRRRMAQQREVALKRRVRQSELEQAERRRRSPRRDDAQ